HRLVERLAQGTPRLDRVDFMLEHVTMLGQILDGMDALFPSVGRYGQPFLGTGEVQAETDNLATVNGFLEYVLVCRQPIPKKYINAAMLHAPRDERQTEMGRFRFVTQRLQK